MREPVGEAATFTAEDAQIAQRLAVEVPAWANFDIDMMCAFVRSYKAYTPRFQETVWHVRHVISWISSLDYDLKDLLRSPPEGRAEFEQMYQAGPVGWDAAGRAVVVERLGSIPARRFCERFTDSEVVRHSVYNREAAIALNRTLSHESGRLIHRITPVIDLKGFGFDHLSRDFLSRTRATITSLQHAYPEAVSGFYVINAPSVFTLIWSIVRPMLDEHTAAIVYVLGGRDEYTPVLERLGVVLEDGHRDIETCPASWQAAMDVVAPDGVKPPPFVPSSDARALRSALTSAGLKMPSCECYSERRPLRRSHRQDQGRSAILSSVSGSARGLAGGDDGADDGAAFDVRLGPDSFHCMDDFLCRGSSERLRSGVSWRPSPSGRASPSSVLVQSITGSAESSATHDASARRSAVGEVVGAADQPVPDGGLLGSAGATSWICAAGVGATAIALLVCGGRG